MTIFDNRNQGHLSQKNDSEPAKSLQDPRRSKIGSILNYDGNS